MIRCLATTAGRRRDSGVTIVPIRIRRSARRSHRAASTGRARRPCRPSAGGPRGRTRPTRAPRPRGPRRTSAGSVKGGTLRAKRIVVTLTAAADGPPRLGLCFSRAPVRCTARYDRGQRSVRATAAPASKERPCRATTRSSVTPTSSTVGPTPTATRCSGTGTSYPGYGQHRPVHLEHGHPGATPATTTGPMTIDSVVQKTASRCSGGRRRVRHLGADPALIKDTQSPTRQAQLYAAMTIGGLGAFALSMVNSFKRIISPALVLVFCAFEGVALGAFSKWFDAVYGGGIVIEAVIGTFAAFAGTLAAYRFFDIKVSSKFRMGVIAAMFGLVGLSFLQLIISLFGGASSVSASAACCSRWSAWCWACSCWCWTRLRRERCPRRPPGARVVARGLRPDRQPGLDLHQPAADPGDHAPLTTSSSRGLWVGAEPGTPAQLHPEALLVAQLGARGLGALTAAVATGIVPSPRVRASARPHRTRAR